MQIFTFGDKTFRDPFENEMVHLKGLFLINKLVQQQQQQKQLIILFLSFFLASSLRFLQLMNEDH